MFGRHKDALREFRARRRQRRADRRELREERRLRGTDRSGALGQAQAKGMDPGKSGLRK
jgi:hypothetical protein